MSIGKTEKINLAFIYLNKDQFRRFTEVADNQITQIQKVAEEQRFKQAMTPIDGLLEQMGANDNEASLVQEEAGKVLEQAEEDQSEALQSPTPPQPTETLAAISDTPEPTPEAEPENKPQPTFPAPTNPTSDQSEDEPSEEPTEEKIPSAPESDETPPPDLPPVPPATQAETVTDTQPSTPAPDKVSQLAEAAALAAPTPETPSQNVYLTGDLGYQIPEASAPTPPVDPAPAPITEPQKTTEPIVNNESSSLFQGGQNENNLFINPASLNPTDLKPVNPSQSS